jgi:hypothetical protein
MSKDETTTKADFSHTTVVSTRQFYGRGTWETNSVKHHCIQFSSHVNFSEAKIVGNSKFYLETVSKTVTRTSS